MKEAMVAMSLMVVAAVAEMLCLNCDVDVVLATNAQCQSLIPSVASPVNNYFLLFCCRSTMTGNSKMVDRRWTEV